MLPFMSKGILHTDQGSELWGDDKGELSLQRES